MERILTPKTDIQTETLQKAIDDCFLAGGGRVVLTAGTYLTGGIRLRSNVTLYPLKFLFLLINLLVLKAAFQFLVVAELLGQMVLLFL